LQCRYRRIVRGRVLVPRCSTVVLRGPACRGSSGGIGVPPGRDRRRSPLISATRKPWTRVATIDTVDDVCVRAREAGLRLSLLLGWGWLRSDAGAPMVGWAGGRGPAAAVALPWWAMRAAGGGRRVDGPVPDPVIACSGWTGRIRGRADRNVDPRLAARWSGRSAAAAGPEQNGPGGTRAQGVCRVAVFLGLDVGKQGHHAGA
jgi:hypothetical protein